MTADTTVKTIASINGAPFDDIPSDLYIPPDYFEILLEQFEGPLDLLLYLIRKKNFDILNLPIGPITEQYLLYLEKFKKTQRELALEYLVMAATLIELKSRLLLPARVTENQDEEEIDPRAALVARLQAYEQCQKMSQSLDELPRIDRDFFLFEQPSDQKAAPYLCAPSQLHEAWQGVMLRQYRLQPHTMEKESFTIEQACLLLTERLEEGGLSFHDWIASNLSYKTNKRYQITFFLAILELTKQAITTILQESCFGPIFILKSKEASYESDALS